MGVRDVATALGRIYSEYVDDLVTPEQAARELGVELPDMIEAVKRSHDPALLALIEGISIQREQWTTVFAEAAVLTVRPTRASTANVEK